MKKLKYTCKNCGYEATLPETRRGCPICGTLLTAGKAEKKVKKKAKATKKKK